MLLSWMPGFLNKQNVQLSSDVFSAVQVIHHLCKKNMQNYIFFVYWGKARCGFCRSLFYIYKVCLNRVIVFMLCMILLDYYRLFKLSEVNMKRLLCQWEMDHRHRRLWFTFVHLHYNWHHQTWSNVIWYACRPGDANHRESVCHSTSNACGWRRSLLFLSPFLYIWVPWARQGLSHLHFLFVNVPSTLPPSVSSVVLPSRLRAEFW